MGGAELRPCKNCGKDFQVNIGRYKHGRGIYCSRSCKNTGMKTSEKRDCPVCNSAFVVYPSSEKRFCSPRCSYDARTLGLVNRVVSKPYKNAGLVADWRKKKCVVCNEAFIAKKRSQSHCCKECVKTTQSKRSRGENNYFYINGNSRLKRFYRGDDWGEARRAVYRRDKWRCRLCGVHCQRKTIQCHHIIPYKQGGTNEMSNLVTLCVYCHPKAERNVRHFNKCFFDNFVPPPATRG